MGASSDCRVGPRAEVTREGFLEGAELMQPLRGGDGDSCGTARAELFLQRGWKGVPQKGWLDGELGFGRMPVSLSWENPPERPERASPSRAAENGHPGLDHRKDFLPSD